MTVYAIAVLPVVIAIVALGVGGPWRAWLCVFRQCDWYHVDAHVWTCANCKTVSKGRDPDVPQ